MEVGQGAGSEREAGGGEVMGLWVAGLGLPGEQGDAPQVRAQTRVGVVEVHAGNGGRAREQAEARARAWWAHAPRCRTRLRNEAEAQVQLPPREWYRVKGLVQAQGGWV